MLPAPLAEEGHCRVFEFARNATFDDIRGIEGCR